ncbi:MAG: serine/threonine-protein kinase [Eubacteriales bacterium]|nr:serine/threonine-protein kinase [Eubacteriales bacterium]MDD3199381.1 serine/threonine-protein kinase [Eubacteriales bacterium]
MTDIKTSIDDFLTSFDDSRYPADFLSNFDMMECLANHNGTETFIVQEKGTDKKYIAKCFDKRSYKLSMAESKILHGIKHKAIPAFIREYENDELLCVIREYIEGLPLSRYQEERQPDYQTVIQIGIQLCDILAYLHNQSPPIIHRDIKPQNVIIADNGRVWLIDFDIARVYDTEANTDTQYFGTKEYAPPEQYGFTQTDCRTDIYSFGVLLRFLVTGSAKENPNIRYYRPLEKIIRKCTAFSPKERYASAEFVKNALRRANPKVQRCKHILIGACGVAIVALCIFGGVKWWQYETREVFTADHTPVFVLTEEQMTDAVNYLNEKYNTDYFKASDDIANMGYMRQMLVDIYGYSSEYAFAMPPEEQQWPEENDNNFYPWGLPETEYVAQDIVVYTIVKILWPDVITDYSSLKDDNGEFPGIRVAVAFAEENGILDGAKRPDDLTYGDVAFIIANAEKYYDKTRQISLKYFRRWAASPPFCFLLC